MKSSIALVAVFASFAAAQNTASATTSGTTPTPSLSPCILTCSQQAAESAGCSSVTDTSCICSGDDNFQNAAQSCINQQCPGQLQEALQVQQAICNAAGSSGISQSPTSTGASTSSLASQSSIASNSLTSSVSETSDSAASSLSSIASAIQSATESPNAAVGLQPLDFIVASLWTAVALGGVAVAQLVL